MSNNSREVHSILHICHATPSKEQQFHKQQFKEDTQYTPYVPCILLKEQQFDKQQFKEEAQYTPYVPCILLKEQQFNKQQFKRGTQHTPYMPCTSLNGTTVP